MLLGLLMVLSVLGLIGMAVGSIWVLVVAGKEGGVHVVLCLFVPFYFFYYIFTRLEQTGIPAAIYGVSLVLTMVFNVAIGSMAGGQMTAQAEDGNWFDPPVGQAGAEFDPAPVPAQSDDDGEMPQPEDPDEAMEADAESEGEPEPESDSEPAEPAGDEPPGDSVAAAEPPGDPDSPDPDSPDPDSPDPDSTEPAPEMPAEPVIVEPTYAEGWKGDAQRAFYRGRNEEGKRFLHASLVSNDGDEAWQPVRYSLALSRPVPALRWGIALQKVDKVPSHIMAMMQRAKQEGGGDGGGGDGEAMLEQPEAPGEEGEGGNVALAQPETVESAPELREYTGDIGSRVMTTLPSGDLTRMLGPLPEGQSWGKQVEFVGVGGDLKEVMSLARQRGVDVVAVAVVTISLRGRIIDATLSVRLIDVATEKRLWTSSTLNSNQVKIAISRGQDPASELVASLKEYVDTKFEMVERPALDKAKVKERLDELVTNYVDNPLPLLFEMRYYQRQGVLTPMQAESYYKSLVGLEDAAAMANGTEDQRKQIADRYVPMSR